MKKSELKQIIKECVKEILFEEGTLSTIVAEVAFGITKAQSLMVESKGSSQAESVDPSAALEAEERRKKSLEARRKLLNAVGGNAMKGVFDSVEPIREAGIPGQGSSSAASPLAGIAANDSGVDISGLMSVSGQKWKKLK